MDDFPDCRVGEDVLFEFFDGKAVPDGDAGCDDDFGSRISQKVATDDTVVGIRYSFSAIKRPE